MIRVGLVIAAVVMASAVLLWLRFSSFTMITALATQRLNHEASYQIITLALFMLFVVLAVVLGGRGVLQYLKPTRFSGAVTPVPWIGLRPREGEGWGRVGSSFLVVITVVTAIVVYIPVIRGGVFSFSVAGVFVPAPPFRCARPARQYPRRCMYAIRALPPHTRCPSSPGPWYRRRHG
jgi:hypothetical protein